MNTAGIVSAIALSAAMAMTAEGASPQISCKARGMDVEVTFYSSSIVRVQKSPVEKKIDKNSLVVIKTPENVEVKTSGSSDMLTAASSEVSVAVDTNTGAVTFTSHPPAKYC